jgi:hypothetical protein
MKIHVYICCILLFVLTCHGAEFDMGTHGILSITAPDNWNINGKAVSRDDGTPIGYTFAIKPRSDAHAKCLLTFAYLTNGAPDKEVIRKEVLRITKQLVRESVEKKTEPERFLTTDWLWRLLRIHGRFIGRQTGETR